MAIQDPTPLLEETDAPTDRNVKRLDVRDLGSPKPLQETLERLVAMEGGVLIQLNDRALMHLYPKLDDRGYEYGTVDTDGPTATAIWEP